MKKILSLCLSILLVLSFCACGNNSKPLDNNHSLIGAWDSEQEGIWIFNKDFSFYALSFDDGLLTSIHDGEKWTKYLQGTYSFDSDKQITISIDTDDNDSDEIYRNLPSFDFEIKETDTSTILSLTDTHFEDTITFYKVANPHSSTLIGDWIILGHGGDFSHFSHYGNVYARAFTFYKDGTYRANLNSWHDGVPFYESDYSGNYELVHDGATISFDGKAFYGVEFFGDSIVFLTDPSGNTLVFAHQ